MEAQSRWYLETLPQGGASAGLAVDPSYLTGSHIVVYDPGG